MFDKEKKLVIFCPIEYYGRQLGDKLIELQLTSAYEVLTSAFLIPSCINRNIIFLALSHYNGPVREADKREYTKILIDLKIRQREYVFVSRTDYDKQIYMKMWNQIHAERGFTITNVNEIFKIDKSDDILTPHNIFKPQ